MRAEQQPGALVRATFSFPDLLGATTQEKCERLSALLTSSIKVPFSEIQNTILLRGNIGVYNSNGWQLQRATILLLTVPRRYAAKHQAMVKFWQFCPFCFSSGSMKVNKLFPENVRVKGKGNVSWHSITPSFPKETYSGKVNQKSQKALRLGFSLLKNIVQAA